jgi:neutral trehalase
MQPSFINFKSFSWIFADYHLQLEQWKELFRKNASASLFYGASPFARAKASGFTNALTPEARGWHG